MSEAARDRGREERRGAARVFGALASGAVRRPLLVLLAALALGAAGAGLAVGLSPSTAVGTFVQGSSRTYRATRAFYRDFGGEPVEIVVKGNLQRLLLSEDLQRLLGLEGCLAGRVSGAGLASEGGARGPCGQLHRMQATKVVIGPATFVNEAAIEIDEGLAGRERQARARAGLAERTVRRRALARGFSAAEASTLGRQAREVNMRAFEAQVAAVAVRYGLSGPPSLTERDFVSTLVFDDAAKVPGTPKQRFAYLFPSREAALISVRLKAGLSEQASTAAIAAVRRAVAMPQWRLTHGESYLVTGEPVILSELADSVSRSILLLLIAATLLMGLMLGLIFRGAPKLLPLAIALLCTAVTFGGLALSGARLSVGEVAVLPVLIGLAVDYAIQLQSRMQEAVEGASSGSTGAASGASRADVRGAIVAAVRLGGPTIAAAAAASGAAMLTLELSPVPTVRAFAVLLVIGLAVALLCAVGVGSAAVALARRVGGGASESRVRASSRGAAAAWIGASWRGAQALVRENPLTRALSRAALTGVRRRPRLALAIGAACATLGFGLSGLTPVQSDVTKLVPSSMRSLRNLATLERLSGVGGELDLLVSGDNVTKPATVEWMRSYEARMLHRFGYRAGRGCGAAPLCPALSLPDLLGAAGGSGGGGGRLSAAAIDGFLATVPPYLSQEVITPDRRAATLAFGLRLMPLSAQQRMIEAMRAALRPPAGVRASLVGLPVLAAQANAQVASAGRRMLQLLLSLVTVALVLLLAFRGSLRRALVPIVPVALASGWSALLLLVLRVPLNPMSVTLGALVIAISTEFSVIVSERYREELGHPGSATAADRERALTVAYRRAGVAVTASAATAIAGFGVLSLSDIAMLRDFGFVTLIDLTVSLLGVLLVLPATIDLAYGERGRHAPVARRVRLRRAGARGVSA